MADPYTIAGEFQGTLGQGQGLWAVLEGNNILIRPQVVIAGTTSTATQGQSVDTWSGAPPAGAFAIPVWNLGPSGGAGSSVTVLNSGGAFGTISTSRTWTLTSGGDSVTAHLDAPISVAATAQTTAKATAADPTYAEGVDSPISQDLSGHLRTLAAVSVPQPLAVNSMQSTGNSAFPWFVSVLNSVGVSATQAGIWTINTIPTGSVGSITVLQGTNPWQVLSMGSVGTVNTIPIGSIGTILVNQGTSPWTVSNQTSVGTVLVTQGTIPWQVLSVGSVGTVLVTQGGAPWSVTNLTSVGTVNVVPIASAGVFAQQAGTWTLSAITSSVGVSATIVGQPINVIDLSSVGTISDNPTTIVSGDQAFAVGSRQPISQTSAGKVIISGADFPNTTIPTYGLVMAGSAGSGFNLSGKTQMLTATPTPLQGSTSSTGMEMGLATRSRLYFGNKATYSASGVSSVGTTLGQTTSIAYLFHNTTDAKRYQIQSVRVSSIASTGTFFLLALARLTSEGSPVSTATSTPLAHDPSDVSSLATFRIGGNGNPVRVAGDSRTVILSPVVDYLFDFTAPFESKPPICPSGTSTGWELRVKGISPVLGPNTASNVSVACSFIWTEELATTQ